MYVFNCLVILPYNSWLSYSGQMMYEIFLEKAEPTAQFIRDQHPYRRLRSSHGTLQSKMSSAEIESIKKKSKL